MLWHGLMDGERKGDNKSTKDDDDDDERGIESL